jgi:hypothetical protein
MPSNNPPTSANKRLPKSTPSQDIGKSAAVLIDARIAALQDWRGDLLARLRAVITSADSGVCEEWKWNVPVWSCGGIICTGETYKKAVKLTFAKGAALTDPSCLFNSSLDGKVRRAIDFAQGAAIDEAALGALVREAIGVNRQTRTAEPPKVS